MGYDAYTLAENFFCQGGWDSYRGVFLYMRGVGVQLRILLIVRGD